MAYVDQFIANLDGKMANSSSQVYKGVAEGEYVVGLTWEDPAANYVKEGAAVEVVFPKEGAIFPGESVQILKDCKHPENAKKFVDYMLSEKIQNAVGSNLTVRPLRKDAKLADYMTPHLKSNCLITTTRAGLLSTRRKLPTSSASIWRHPWTNPLPAHLTEHTAPA